MSNVQLTLGDESIDALIDRLKKMKENNNTVIRMGGDKGAPGLIFVHKNFKVPKENKKEEQ
ncbi:MAG: hypothetical protein NT001_07715 [Candidatus Woesearchaeota archaeon]|nr:hypothetical protein [Candidatus Woesearchaeota archaeon]